MTEGPPIDKTEPGQTRVQGPVERVLGPVEHTISNVAPLRRPPGQTPPEAHAVAVERLMEAMIMSATISWAAADSFIMMLKVASVAAPYGEHGAAVARIIASLTKRLEAHLATLPNTRPPGIA